VSGYQCAYGDGHEPAVQLATSLETGATVAICADCLPVHLAGALSVVTGVDAGDLYDAVQALLADLAGEAGQDTGGPATDEGQAVTQPCPYCSLEIHGTLAGIDSGLRRHIEHCEQAPQED